MSGDGGDPTPALTSLGGRGAAPPADTAAPGAAPGWRRQSETEVGRFLATETGSALALLAAVVAALVWANADTHSYDHVWSLDLSVRVGGSGISMSLAEWIAEGLMAVYFFVIGLEARREFDIGDLRERERALLPVAAGLGGMAIPILLFLVVNAGHPSAQGWGVAMSTDTAFALGILVLVGPRYPERLRAFLLTVVVVDDVVAVLVVTFVYARHLSWLPLGIAVGLFALLVVAIVARTQPRIATVLLAVAVWVALWEAGLDPLIVGIAAGLLTSAAPVARTTLEQASQLFRGFREQPTPELARAAEAGVRTAVSANERLEDILHPWTSYLVVPLFTLSRIGIPLTARFVSHAFGSPITLGIIVGYVLGKPLGVLGLSWAVTTLTRGRLRPPVGWLAVAGGGALAGIGFTVSLLVASLAFHGAQQQEAKLGVLTAAVGSTLLTWLVFRAAARLPDRIRVPLLSGTSRAIVDLLDPVDPAVDHVRGPLDAPVTVVEYGDFECPYCGRAEPVVREVLADFSDVRYVWRHLPLVDVHPFAQQAAEASEAAAAQGAFWPMHDLLIGHQGELRRADLLRYAAQIGLDTDRFTRDLETHAAAGPVAAGVDSADRSGVAGTPTFFINGRRHRGAYDLDGLTQAIRRAEALAPAAA